MNSYEPLVSVLIATHNPDIDLFEISLESIITQTYKNLEIVIVDDGSEEQLSLEIIKICQKYSITKLHRINENVGLAKALNIGVTLCTGEYIARMDDDDISLPNRIENQVSYLLKNKGFISFTAVEVINVEGNSITEIIHKNIEKKTTLKLIIKGNVFTHSSAMFERKAFVRIGGYCESLVYAQDYDLWVRFSKEYKIYYIPKVLVKWRYEKNTKKMEKEALQTATVFYTKYLYLLKSNKKFKSKIIFLLSALYLLLQIILLKVRQYE